MRLSEACASPLPRAERGNALLQFGRFVIVGVANTAIGLTVTYFGRAALSLDSAWVMLGTKRSPG